MIRSIAAKMIATTVVIFTICATSLVAQPVQNASIASKISVQVTTLFKAPPAENDLRKLFSDILREELDIAGFQQSKTPELSLIVSAISVPGDYVAISVAVMHRLPEPIVEFAAEHEAYYMNHQGVDLPEEGKSIRQYMSREYMQQFESLSDQFETVTKSNDLRSAAKEVIEVIFSRHQYNEDKR